MIVERDLPTLDGKALTFLESVQAVTSLHGFDSGMLPWLSRFRPMLHAELTGLLVDRIQASWASNHLEDFADALADFERAFTETVELYRRWKEGENGR